MNQEINESVNQSFIRPIGGLKMTQDEIIIQNQQTHNTIQSVLCPVCLCVLTLPHWSCDKCENVFCKDCMQQWWIKSPNTCIFKCEEAQFKMIKRSHAYQALMQILKVSCKTCETAIPISRISSHDTVCPKKLIQCTFQGCQQIILRFELEQHLKNCQFRKAQCSLCNQLFFIGALQNHNSSQCQQRMIKCLNEGCNYAQKAKIYGQHQKNCEFIQVECKFCRKIFAKKEYQIHSNQCIQRQYDCQWCQQHFKSPEFKQHKNKCIEARINCELCNQSVKQVEYKDHKFDCMFSQMIKLKKFDEQLIVQNTKLKQKVNQLQYALEQLSKNRHQATLKSFIQIKEEEKKQLQKDLLRIKNSLNSIKRMRNQQLTQHQKRPHLSVSLCVFCNTIRKKMQDQLEPLLKLQDQINQKIKQIERTEYATRRSIIRIGEK